MRRKNFFRRHRIILGILFVAIGTIAFASIITNMPASQNNDGRNTAINKDVSGGQNNTNEIYALEPIHLSAKNWDTDTEADGLGFYLYPKDKNGNAVRSTGNLSIKLWKKVGERYECLKRAEDLLEQWDNLSVMWDDYGFAGATIGVGYKKYKPTNDTYAMGCAEAIFTTTGGKSFKSLDDTIFINGVPER